MKVYGEVYIVVNRVNQKVYIGQTVLTRHSRWRSHCGRALRGSEFHFHRAIRKYGENNFNVYRLNIAFSKEELDSLEMAYIEKYQAANPTHGYNTALGGGGVVPNEATRTKLREANRGENNPRFGTRVSEETRKRMSAAQKGHSVSMVTRRAVAEANKRRAPNPPNFTGRTHSAETKQKMREARLGKPAWNKGRTMPEGFAEKVAAAKRGKPRPAHVSEALRLANRNRPSTCWIIRESVVLKVMLSELDSYISQGFRKGRK